MYELTGINMDVSGNSPKAKAARVKQLRKLMGLTIDQLAKLLGYTRQTVSCWENANEEGEVGVSDKGATRLVEVARNNGIGCDVKWLLFGFGQLSIAASGTRYEITAKSEHGIKVLDEPKQMGWAQDAITVLYANIRFYDEIKAFLNSAPSAIVACIQNDGMEPAYKKGDWVGGYLTPVHEKLDGKICIVNVSQSPQVRLVTLGKTSDTFNLSCLKKIHGLSDFRLKDVVMQEAAEVIRFWRK